MSRLKELWLMYAKENKRIPVEYCSHSGITSNGSITKIREDGLCLIEVYGGTGCPEYTTMRVNVNGFAGAANPAEWCLARTAHAIYNQLSKPEYSELALKTHQVLKLMVKQANLIYPLKPAMVVEWPGRESYDMIGVLLIDAEKRSGFVVTSKDEPNEFYDKIPEDVVLHLID